MQVAHSAEQVGVPTAGSNAGKSVLVGLVGRNIQRSRTPRMHEVEGARVGFNYTYTLIDTARFDAAGTSIADVLNAARICGFAGLNITYPHKQTIVPLLDNLSAAAAEIGAVNTVTFTENGTVGHNTDKFGFAEGFRQEMQGAALGSVLQIGAGGAGAAVASALVELGAKKIFIADIETERAETMAERLRPYATRTIIETVDVTKLADIAFDGLVNTTPVGMDATPGLPIDPTLLTPEKWVADIIYFPLETALLRAARGLGCRTLSGSAMAIFQAVKAFELFTGQIPDSAQMKATFDAFQGDQVARP